MKEDDLCKCRHPRRIHGTVSGDPERYMRSCLFCPSCSTFKPAPTIGKNKVMRVNPKESELYPQKKSKIVKK